MKAKKTLPELLADLDRLNKELQEIQTPEYIERRAIRIRWTTPDGEQIKKDLERIVNLYK